MPRFVTIGYGDRAGYDRTAPEIRDAAHVQDAALVARGAVMGMAGSPVQVRNPDATGVSTTDGPFMTTALPIAGFALIEAADMAEAVALVSGVPCAVAHGVVEIWPLEEPGQS
ncbi:YciI family protein [uncultured Bosea sp.]|uniref:YciI family protein n=1 Tax=uncultured Bosea sp. TaxID=211457 RepID=UPI0025D1C9FE|nr:YciI family protein [uncultured Bosea sp.]